jgi:uncharacterized protein (DUF2141 family)
MTLRLISTLLLSIGLASPVQAEKIKLNIVIDGISHNSGSLIARVYNKDNWLGDEPLLSQSLPIPKSFDGGPLTMYLDIDAGKYSFAVYHDVDGNGQMNKNFIGLPAEPVGLSNKHVPRFGPPRYRKAEMKIDKNTDTIYITLD